MLYDKDIGKAAENLIDEYQALQIRVHIAPDIFDYHRVWLCFSV